MKITRKSTHSVYSLKVHLVWVTKYRYHVLQGSIQRRCRDILRQVCDANDIRILKGVVSKDHIHMHLSYPAKLSVIEIVKRLKGRSARILLREYPRLQERYWGRHFWAIGYEAWSTGNLSDDLVQEYLSHHVDYPNSDEHFLLG